MTVDAGTKPSSNKFGATLAVSIMLAMSLSPMLIIMTEGGALNKDSEGMMTSGDEPWSDGDQPWPQPGRTPDRASVPPHHVHSTDSATGGLLSIVEPAINWEFGSDQLGTDSLGTPIADFSSSLTTDPSSEERCGGDSLYTILVQTDSASGESYMKIIEGEDSDLAWEVSLGTTEMVKSSPVVVDLDNDGRPEVIVAYDQSGTLHVDAWSPRLFCSVTGWDPGAGSSQQPIWTWEEDDLMISGDPTSTLNGLGGHRPTTQPLLADLDLDGDAELVLATINENSGDPVGVALSLPSSGTPATLWEKTLDKGSHPSDPAFAQTDENTGYVVLTTTEHTNGGMWVWRLDSTSGDSGWDGLSLSNVDGDSDVPHIRLPGPVVANLDADETPEIVVTIPTDADGSNTIDLSLIHI